MSDTLQGKLLVAMPGMSDPRFDRTVIMMCTHDAEHAMGVVINKPKEELTLSEVLEHLGLEADDDVADRVVLDGGPVRPDRGYVLHSEDFAAGDATQNVAPGIRLTATRWRRSRGTKRRSAFCWRSVARAGARGSWRMS